MNYSYQVGRGGGVRVRTQYFFNLSNSNGANVWLCVSVQFPRIEPVGEPYRQVCLLSEL